MPPQNAVIDHNSVLCLKHFSPRDVAVCSNILKEATGITEVRYGTPLVREGATPTIFLRDVTDGTQNELKVGERGSEESWKDVSNVATLVTMDLSEFLSF